MKICSKQLFFCLVVCHTTRKPVQKSWDTKKMMHIDFEDVHDVTGWSTENVDHLVLHKKLPASGLAAAGQFRVRLELSYLLIGALFERNQLLSQKPIHVIDCIKAVDGEVRVPRVDSLKRHVLKRFQKINSFESSILKDLSEKVSILYPNIDGVSNPCNFRGNGITNKDFLSTFGKMIKSKIIKDVHNYFIEILGFDEKSSDAALNNKYKQMTEIKSNLQENQEYDELDRFLKLPLSLPQCHQNNKNAHKRKADTNATFTEISDFRHFEKRLHIAESKLEISCNIIDDFRQLYELSLDEIYYLQGEIDELVDECCQQKHTILTLNSKLSQIQKKYKTQSEKIDQILQRQESISVPKHNRASEKNFAGMKQIRHFKPNASIEHIEATLMWINNKTVEWLDSMDFQDKNYKITLAKKRAPDYLTKWQERRKEFKQKRINRMKDKELEKLKKSAQHLQNKQNPIDNLLCLNIQPCKTSVDITTLLESCTNEHEKESVVKVQIAYFKWVMSPPNIAHTLFFFSKERKKLSCETLIQNLMKIVNHTNSVLTGIDATLNIPKEQRKQLVLHKQDEHISAFQRSARNQNPTEEWL